MMTTKRFAANTSVPVDRSRAEIEKLIHRYGATATAIMNASDRAVIAFEMEERRVVFELPLPRRDEQRFTHYRYRGCLLKPRSSIETNRVYEQACRQAWRALSLVIKAKLEAVEAGVSSFEDEFLANIMMPDGKTVAAHVRPRVAAIYESNTMQPLLPGPTH